jgi:flagellar FliL protein
MKKLIIPVILGLVGTAGGAATGLFLIPPSGPEPTQDETSCVVEESADSDAANIAELPEHATPSAFVALSNQFIVPIVDGNEVDALVILSASIEVPEDAQDAVLQAEPRLRDAFLQVLFDHANTGGFAGTFTATETMRRLRLALDAASSEILGATSRNVLIVDIIRQDV